MRSSNWASRTSELRADLPDDLLEGLFEYALIAAIKPFYLEPETIIKRTSPSSNRWICFCVGRKSESFSNTCRRNRMSSIKSKLVIFIIQHAHLFKGRLKRDVITRETSIPDCASSLKPAPKNSAKSRRASRSPPCTIPGLPDGHFAEWIHPAGSPDSPGRIRQGHLLYPRRRLCHRQL